MHCCLLQNQLPNLLELFFLSLLLYLLPSLYLLAIFIEIHVLEQIKAFDTQYEVCLRKDVI